jgi:ABC-2 type transport system ATP-binding protein
VIIEADGLVKTYGDRRVLDGVSLGAEEGSVLALLGPNGAGKTTTVRILATLSRPDAGTARVAGHDVVRDAAAVRGLISLTGQFTAVDDRQTGEENLVMVGRLVHLGRARARLRAAELLDRFDLGEARSRRVGEWSGGMRRRLDLAMSLIAAPRVIFLDEPTTGLDPASRTAMWAAISELVAGGTTILLTTPYLEEADQLADRIVLVDDGRVTASGTADQLKAQIGGSQVELRFTTDADLHRAVSVLHHLGAHPDPAAAAVRLPSDGSADHLRRLLDDLHSAGVPVATAATRRPTLDDVFLALTAGTRTDRSPALTSGGLA